MRKISDYVIRWLGRRKEKGTLDLIQKNVGEAFEISKEFREGFRLYCDGNFEESRKIMQKVLEIEKEADETKRKIALELSKGVFLPVDREDLLRLALQIDEAIDEIEGAARRLNLFEAKPPEELREGLLIMCDEVVNIFEKLREAIPKLKIGVDDALKAADEVEEREERIDSIHMDVLKRILSQRRGDVISTFLLREVIENLENAADNVEDAADILRILAIEYHA